jgi:hypothetical protein
MVLSGDVTEIAWWCHPNGGNIDSMTLANNGRKITNV